MGSTKAVYVVNGRIEQCNYLIKQGVERIQELAHQRDNLLLEMIPREWT